MECSYVMRAMNPEGFYVQIKDYGKYYEVRMLNPDKKLVLVKTCQNFKKALEIAKLNNLKNH